VRQLLRSNSPFVTPCLLSIISSGLIVCQCPQFGSGMADGGGFVNMGEHTEIFNFSQEFSGLLFGGHLVEVLRNDE
jgi:hypothetical protein